MFLQRNDKLLLANPAIGSQVFVYLAVMLDGFSRRVIGWALGRTLEADAVLPSSALGRAANYTLSLWRKLTRFLEYPDLELSNNLAENSMRPVALER